MRRRFVRTGALACHACCIHLFRARLIRKRAARDRPPMDRTLGRPTRNHSPFPSGIQTHFPDSRNSIDDLPDDPCTELIERISLTISSRPAPHTHRIPPLTDFSYIATYLVNDETCITLVPVIRLPPRSHIMGSHINRCLIGIACIGIEPRHAIRAIPTVSKNRFQPRRG